MRTLLGVKRHLVETLMLHIPKTAILEFSQINEISGGCFNIPMKHNKFSSIDLVCPNRVESYQIAKGETPLPIVLSARPPNWLSHARRNLSRTPPEI